VLVILVAFLALTASAGGVGLLGGSITPPLEMLDGSPFRSYTVPGLSLLVLVGGSALAATAMMLYRHRWGIPTSAVAGIMIIGFEIVEVMAIGSPAGLARNLQIFYFTLGVCIFALAASIWATEHSGTSGRLGQSPVH
jgi:hypothetical protein